jgi:hypothetical protein
MKAKKYLVVSSILILIFACFVCLAGCVNGGPVISKSGVGNLEINVRHPEGGTLSAANLYIDSVFVGTVSNHKPIIYLRRGERTIRVEAQGYKTYKKKITILGEPNQQVLNIFLVPKK